MQIDRDAPPADAGILQQMLRDVVPELLAENEKILRMVECLLRHRFGRRSEKLDLDQMRLLLEDEAQGQAENEAAREATEAGAESVAAQQRGLASVPTYVCSDIASAFSLILATNGFSLMPGDAPAGRRPGAAATRHRLSAARAPADPGCGSADHLPAGWRWRELCGGVSRSEPVTKSGSTPWLG